MPNNTKSTGICCVECGAAISQEEMHTSKEGRMLCARCGNPHASFPGGGFEIVCARCGTSIQAEEAVHAGKQLVCHACASKQEEAIPGSSTRGRRLPKGILHKITCPHCWARFGPDQILWISQHVDLTGDPVLGSEAPTRFLPTRFNVQGEAIDARGMACQSLACPRCHLTIPRALVEIEPLFLSIIGVPASGKSYFLTALTWELRKLLPQRFAIAFNDADTISNRSLNEYEETLFLRTNPEEPVAIIKTPLTGDLYDHIMLGQQDVSLPRPFLFSLRPAREHFAAAQSAQLAKVICLYDNAGEHFEPGQDSVRSPVTRHLANSRVLMFLYDPTKDARFRDQCRKLSNDPQLAAESRSQRQETILTEAAQRIRRYAGLTTGQKHSRPLLVIVPKADVWGGLLDEDLSREPIVLGGSGIDAVDVPRIEAVSAKVRAMLMRYTPEFVAAAEDFWSTVVYFPASVFARPPVAMAEGGLGIRPIDIEPRWVSAPILYMFAKWSSRLFKTTLASGGVKR